MGTSFNIHITCQWGKCEILGDNHITCLTHTWAQMCTCFKFIIQISLRFVKLKVVGFLLLLFKQCEIWQCWTATIPYSKLVDSTSHSSISSLRKKYFLVVSGELWYGVICVTMKIRKRFSVHSVLLCKYINSAIK